MILNMIIASLALNVSQPQTVKISIATVPAKAEVCLNGKVIGKSPCKTALTGTTNQLLIRMPGYREYTASLGLSNIQPLFVRLSPTSSHYNFIKRFKTGHLPKDLIYSPDGRYLMIPFLADDGLQIYDGATGELRWVHIKKYGKFVGYVEGVFTDDGREFWFTQVNDKGRVFVLSMDDFTIRQEIPTHGDWTKVGEFTPDGKYYYVSNWLSDDISVIDRHTYQFIRLIKTTGKAPRGIGFSDDGKFLYAVFYDSGEIMKYDIAHNYKLVKRTVTGGANGRFRIDHVKQVAYINNMHNGLVYIYDLKTDKIIGEMKAWINPNNVKIAPGGRFIYVSNRGPNNPKSYELPSPENGKIQIFDAENGYKLWETLDTGNQPIGIAITPDGKTLSIGNFMDDTVEIYSIL